MSAPSGLAVRAGDDVDTAQVYLDALLEGVERDERVMMLCLGVPLDRRPPSHLGETGRRTWKLQRRESIRFALRQWDLYMGHRADFARACHAVAIFGSWLLRGSTGASPWATCRAADPDYQLRLAQRRDRRIAREHFRAAREVRDNALRAVRREGHQVSDEQKGNSRG